LRQSQTNEQSTPPVLVDVGLVDDALVDVSVVSEVGDVLVLVVVLGEVLVGLDVLEVDVGVDGLVLLGEVLDTDVDVSDVSVELVSDVGLVEVNVVSDVSDVVVDALVPPVDVVVDGEVEVSVVVLVSVLWLSLVSLNVVDVDVVLVGELVDVNVDVLLEDVGDELLIPLNSWIFPMQTSKSTRMIHASRGSSKLTSNIPSPMFWNVGES
jgi:hypothetical protein